MRKCRGLTKEGKWVYGWYFQRGKDSYIINDSGFDYPSIQIDPNSYPVQMPSLTENQFVEVTPASVGQFTGRKSIKGWTQDGIGKGEEIYEGDFLDFPTSGIAAPPYLVGPINRYEKTAYGLEGYPRLEAGEVIGNKTENPELLEAE